ncbi:hypothetical protein [Caulobacter sp. RL271]|uniref:Uncharacterized protein n=1 Tax=Caulobacter segnis TaxID=88688 RepID=A0ABY4ZNZ1_9CAUL|nr:hypothetical protein [Caulobacter segnis]USQ94400.1 hypothetical protein MZV50_17640 [Caulobacter segnis]
MTSVLDLFTCGASIAAALALALRGNMLKPEARAWASSRAASLIVLALSIVMAGEAIEVWRHGGVTPREAVVVAAIAVASVLMLLHLGGQRRAPTA